MRVIEAFLRVSRAALWWQYKIPPLLAVGYALLLVRGGGRGAVATLLWSIAALCCVATFAYVVNDATDVAEDAARGKSNAMATTGVAGRLLLGGILVVGAFAAAIAGGASAVAHLVLGVECLLPLLYSVRPVRLKERGVLGVVVDAALVHVVPVWWIALMLSEHGRDSARAAMVTASALVWATGLGLRGILVHQAHVRATGANVATFAARLSMQEVRTIVLRRLLPMEWLAVAVFIVALAPVAPVVAALGVLLVLVELLRVRAGWKVPYLRDDDGDPRYVPLAFNDCYEVWLPLALVLQLAAGDAMLALLAGVHGIAFLPNLRESIRGVRMLAVQAGRAATQAGT